MNSNITEGIILKKTNFKDNKVLVNIYTEKLGKISTSVIGVNKISSKLNSHLQAGNLVKIYLIKKKNYYRVANIETLRTYSRFISNFNNSVLLFTILELITKIYEEEHVDNIMFSFLQKSFCFFDESDLNEFFCMNCILIKLISFNGIFGNQLFEFFDNKNDINKLKKIREAKYSDINEDYKFTIAHQNIFMILIDYIQIELEVNIKSTQALIL